MRRVGGRGRGAGAGNEVNRLNNKVHCMLGKEIPSLHEKKDR